MNESLKAVALIEKLLRRKALPADGIKELAEFAERRRPHTAWKKLRRLDYAEDVGFLEKWLKDLLRTEPPGSKINGLYFGLYEAEKAYVLYACGSDHYDPSDGDWACDPAWWPDSRIAWSPALIKMHAILKRMPYDARLLGEYCYWFGYAALAVAHLCRTIDSRLLLGKLKSRAVTVGFDDGDFVNLPPLAEARNRSR